LRKEKGMMNCNTSSLVMPLAKIAITMEPRLLKQIDGLVASQMFPNRSRAIQEAVVEKLHRMDRARLARECAKLDPAFEQAMAEEGISGDVETWPEY
jgi:Arc/MetJ-type ribon-helix-helix transcriptional regulator